ncbi:MAG: site-specific integrase [Cyanobacteria bacterium]|nr:site-specific integrase [Cyanobacteriota bacterium]
MTFKASDTGTRKIRGLKSRNDGIPENSFERGPLLDPHPEQISEGHMLYSGQNRLKQGIYPKKEAMPAFEPFEVKSIKEIMKRLKINRDSYYFYVRDGQIVVERVYKENSLIYNVYQKPSQPKAALERTASEREATMDHECEVVSPEPEQVTVDEPPVEELDTDQLKVPHKRFMDEWILWRDEGIGTKNWSASHKKRSVSLMKKFFGQWKYLTPEAAEEYLLQTPVASYSQRRCKHAALSSYAKFLNQKKKLINREAYFDIKALYPKKPKDYIRDIKIIHDEHIEPILNTIPKLYSHDAYKKTLLRSLIIFLSETAVRISEAAGLVSQNLVFNKDPRQAYVYLPEHITKNGKERYVPFSPKAQAAVKEYLQIRPTDTAFDQVFLFNHRVWGYSTLKPTSVGHIFTDMSNHCGIPFSAHTFRHYRITKWANDPKISVTDVQYWAGHESLMVTQGYIHVRGLHSIQAAFSDSNIEDKEPEREPEPPQPLPATQTEQPTAPKVSPSKMENLVQLLGKMETLNISPEEQLNMLKLMVT